MKGEGKNCELAEGAMRGWVSAEAHLRTRGGTVRKNERGRRGKEEKTDGRHEKGGRKERKEDEFRKKVHKFSFQTITKTRKRKLFLEKRCAFEIKSLPLRLIKHKFLFFTAALRRPYSAKSWGNLDESAQMLFDLLKKSRYSTV